MSNYLRTTITLYVLLTCVLAHHDSHAQLMVTSDTPGPISQLLQLVWEPSSLIRMWTALDQLYNVLLGWRSAARTVVELPFRQGRSMEHVRIQEPRKFNRRLHGQSSDMPHWDWFKRVYEESGDDPRTAESLVRPVIADESYQQMLMAQQFLDGSNVPYGLRQSLNTIKGSGQNSVNVPGANRNVIPNLQQSLNSLSGNVYNSPAANENFLPYLQQSLNALSGNVHSSINVPVGNRNVFLSIQQTLNDLKEAFRNLATSHRSLNALRGNSLNAPVANGNTFYSLHQLPNVPAMDNNIQTDVRYQHLLHPAFAFHPKEMYNTMDSPSKMGNFRRNVKIAQKTNNFLHSGGQETSGQHRINGPNNANVPMMFFNANGVPNSNPETRLRMFLKLMGNLGEMHKKSVKAVEFDDDVNERSDLSGSRRK